MLIEYAIKCKTTIDDFIHKYPRFCVLFRDDKRNIHYFINPFDEKMKFGFDMNRFINYIAVPANKNIFPTLYLLIVLEKALIMPCDLVQNLKECEIIKNSGKEEYLLSLNFERVTTSCLTFMNRYTEVGVDEYCYMMFAMDSYQRFDD